jgi:hypothetical protein
MRVPRLKLQLLSHLSCFIACLVHIEPNRNNTSYPIRPNGMNGRALAAA